MIKFKVAWDVSNVKNMYGMFSGATSFNQPLNKWNVSNDVTDMEGMFAIAEDFNQPLNNWNVSNEQIWDGCWVPPSLLQLYVELRKTLGFRVTDQAAGKS